MGITTRTQPAQLDQAVPVVHQPTDRLVGSPFSVRSIPPAPGFDQFGNVTSKMGTGSANPFRLRTPLDSNPMSFPAKNRERRSKQRCHPSKQPRTAVRRVAPTIRTGRRPPSRAPHADPDPQVDRWLNLLIPPLQRSLHVDAGFDGTRNGDERGHDAVAGVLHFAPTPFIQCGTHNLVVFVEERHIPFVTELLRAFRGVTQVRE